jgi:hypothetical protein
MGDGSLQSHSGANLNPKTVKDRGNVSKGGEAGGVALTDPPIPVTGHLPHPLGPSVLRNTEWYDMCPLENICFKELYELMKTTSPAACKRGDECSTLTHPCTTMCR